MHIENSFFNLLEQWQTILSPLPQRKLPVAPSQHWNEQESEHSTFVSAIVVEVEDTGADSDVDDDEEGMQAELV